MTPYIERLTQEVVTTAKIGGQETIDVVERLLPALEAAFRLTLTEAVTKAAHDITLTLQEQDAPATVDTRLSPNGVDFLVTLTETPTAPEPEPAPVDPDEDASARITLRLGENLKAKLEQAASEHGQSLNTFIVGALRSVVHRRGQFGPGRGFGMDPIPGAPVPPRPPRGPGSRFQGWI